MKNREVGAVLEKPQPKRFIKGINDLINVSQQSSCELLMNAAKAGPF